MTIHHFYSLEGLSRGSCEALCTKLNQNQTMCRVQEITTESCFTVEYQKEGLSDDHQTLLEWILSESLTNSPIQETPFLHQKQNSILIEIGPRLNFSTAFSTNAVSICRSIGLIQVSRIEISTRYLIQIGSSSEPMEKVISTLTNLLHDRMTQCCYKEPIRSFELENNQQEVYSVKVLEKGRSALEKVNKDLGLAWDDWDLDFYTSLFSQKIKRNPTSVECFDLAQSNSEHSRHWFFVGRLVIDGVESPNSLMKMVKATQKYSNMNNVIAFSDNSSAIIGYPIRTLVPNCPGKASFFKTSDDIVHHVIFTAETHNFPTGVAPFPGASTGTGGRIRDVQATGRGAHVIAGTAGYCVGNLNIPDYDIAGEDNSFQYPSNFSSPLEILIQASNGASDYGNKFGEPILTGFARSFGLQIGQNRREWVKPIMFSGGIGSMQEGHVHKEAPEKGMSIVKIGGPVYRIGVGGGAASSIQVQGDNEEELDFGAVQRGDAEMEQKMNRVIRACVELAGDNPICSIHDQGAGGNGNVLKEISEPAGALIKVGKFHLADPTLSILEIWGAEYQESNAILIRDENQAMIKEIASRERCPVDFVGVITGSGKIQLEDDRNHQVPKDEQEILSNQKCIYPVDLDLEYVLGKMPQKVFKLERNQQKSTELSLPGDLTVMDALHKVLKLPSVASKRYLTNKVDRSVTGLVAQQQCVGPLHTPLADVAVIALSYFDIVGSATSIGEQPIKGLVDNRCGARMTVGESLTNLVFVQVSDIKDIKCSSNWMWPAKLPGEGAALHDTCEAMCEVMQELGIAVDGGKDSLSMAARLNQTTIKAPGTLVVSSYVTCPDIRKKLTPDLKCVDGEGYLIYVPFNPELKCRLGGTALAQSYKQIGQVTADMDEPDYFVKAFNAVQKAISLQTVKSGHDVSDGGLITCLLEMAFAGNCGLDIDIPASFVSFPTLEVLFAEELGVVLEASHVSSVENHFTQMGVRTYLLGTCHGTSDVISITRNGVEIVNEKVARLRDDWECTSFQLERLQTNHSCVQEEFDGLKDRCSPKYKLTFNPEVSLIKDIPEVAIRIAVIREEGSNGDREMSAAFHMAGFQVWDVNMHDLINTDLTLGRFRGVAFVGGFSFADVLGSAKGWAASLKFNKKLQAELDQFYKRSNTFSLGVCNGCQLMALLGWVAPNTSGSDLSINQGVAFKRNRSERFESRFSTVRIEKSPSIMLDSMAGSVLGIWVAHGEGQITFKNSEVEQSVVRNLVPLRYVNDDGDKSMTYPFNPNGSIDAIAALCSPDGRHLAMMPHPERCVMTWQWPWMPTDWTMKTSPWMKMFTNAYQWCCTS